MTCKSTTTAAAATTTAATAAAAAAAAAGTMSINQNRPRFLSFGRSVAASCEDGNESLVLQTQGSC